MAEQNKNKGFIALYRSIQDHWIWESNEFSQFQAWIDLLLMVNHEDKKTVFDGKLTEIKKGSRITSIRKLCERWNWSNTKVVNFLNNLELDGMITRESDTKKTVITIVNYEVYQSLRDTKTTQKRHSSDTEATQKRHRNTQTTIITTKEPLEPLLTTNKANVFIELPLNDGSFHFVSNEDVEQYEKLYPAVEVKQEIRNMLGWLDSNPTRRKTKTGIKRFITSWLARTQNSGGNKKAVRQAPKDEDYLPENPENNALNWL